MWRPCACAGRPAPGVRVPWMPPPRGTLVGRAFLEGVQPHGSGESARGAEQGWCLLIAGESPPPGGQCAERTAAELRGEGWWGIGGLPGPLRGAVRPCGSGWSEHPQLEAGRAAWALWMGAGVREMFECQGQSGPGRGTSSLCWPAWASSRGPFRHFPTQVCHACRGCPHRGPRPAESLPSVHSHSSPGVSAGQLRPRGHCVMSGDICGCRDGEGCAEGWGP